MDRLTSRGEWGARSRSESGSRSRSRSRSVAVALLVAAACSPGAKKPGPASGLGRAVWSGPARSLRASPDGAWLAFLDACREAKGQFLPPGTANCDLRAVRSGGGDARLVAHAVTTLPQGFVWSPSGAALAALGGYDYGAGAGDLTLWRPGSEPRAVASGVTYDGFGPGGELGAVAGGKLVLVAGEGVAEVKGARDVATFEFRPAAREAGAARIEALARRGAGAGGDLLGVRGGGAFPVAPNVLEYLWSADGRWAAFTSREGSVQPLHLASGDAVAQARRVAADGRQAAFSPAGDALAFLAGTAPGRQGDLTLIVPGRGGATSLAREVGEYRWAARVSRLAWLERYDPRVRSGTLGVGGLGLAPRTVAAHVSDFDLAPDGRRVAYLQHTTRGGYSVDLGMADVEAPAGAAPAVVAQGVFGFAFSPDGRWLYYRTRCTRNGEACDLERVPAAGLGPGEKPERIAQGAKSFDFDPRDPERLLIGFQRMDMVALDVAVWDRGRLVAVEQAVEPGTAQFLGPDSRRLAYVVVHPKRAGVYVAELAR